jgi:DNA-binding CsgD family transcriptional regulator
VADHGRRFVAATGGAMGKSQRLRLSDVRGVFHLLGECRELGDDAEAWPRHMQAGLCRLTRAQLGVGGLVRLVGPEHLMAPVSFADHGWPDPRSKARFLAMLKDPAVLNNLVMRRFHQLTAPCVTRTRQHLVEDRPYYASAFHNECHRPFGLDHGLLSRNQPPGRDWHHELSLERVQGAPPFGRRECRLMHLFQLEIGPLLGGALATPEEPPLSPRQRQTLTALLEGDSEKQAARRLGLSVNTVHGYVTSLYKHFGASSRAELLAHFLRRFRRRGGAT